MSRKRHTPEQIIRKLREAEVELSKGLTTGDVVRKLGITEQTYYRWRKEYGGLRLDQAKRLKEVDKENSRLKKLLAEQALDGTSRQVARGVARLEIVLAEAVVRRVELGDVRGVGAERSVPAMRCPRPR